MGKSVVMTQGNVLCHLREAHSRLGGPSPQVLNPSCIFSIGLDQIYFNQCAP